jgi:thioredoxin reductase
VTADAVAREVDVLVVGAGPAGLTAAAALARAGVGTVEVLDRERVAGGIPRHSEHLGYGIRDLHRVVSGPEYARRLIDDAVAAGAILRVGVSVTGWSAGPTHPAGGPPALATTSRAGLETLRARAVVLATGARERPRAARGVPGVRASGVYTTGELQQAVYTHGQRIGTRAVIVGAEHVSFSAAVTLDHAGVDVAAMVTERARQQSYLLFRAGAAMVYRFPVLTGVSVQRIVGRQGRVEGVEVAHPGGTLETVRCDTVVFTGDWIADNELARTAGLAIDASSTGPLVDTGLRTSRPGVYGAGNLLHPVLNADAAALDGKAVAESVLADLLRSDASADLPGWEHAGVRLTVRPPLRWVAPGRVVDPSTPPPRGRFVLWVDDFLLAPRIEVRQGERLLHSSRPPRALVPGRPFEIGASWLPRVLAEGPDVEVTVR